MKKALVFCILALCLAGAAPVQAQTQVTAQQALEFVDLVRAPGADFIFSVTAKTSDPKSSEYFLSVRVRENTKSLVQYRRPVKERGKALLLDGMDTFIFIPGTNRAMRITPAQFLTSGVTFADIARVVFNIDYDAKSVEVLEENGEYIYKLGLTSKPGASNRYQTITLYCNQKFEPIKAEFFAISGMLMRTAYYENYQMVLGKMRPMTIRMESAISSKENAVLTYSEMEIKDTPAHYYQPSYLEQLR